MESEQPDSDKANDELGLPLELAHVLTLTQRDVRGDRLAGAEVTAAEALTDTLMLADCDALELVLDDALAEAEAGPLAHAPDGDAPPLPLGVASSDAHGDSDALPLTHTLTDALDDDCALDA